MKNFLQNNLTLYTPKNLDSILKSRDITLPTKVHLVKAMVFLVVMYGCECRNIKKAGVVILIPDKIDIKIKKITRDKEGHYIMIKGSIQEEDKTFRKLRLWHSVPSLHGR